MKMFFQFKSFVLPLRIALPSSNGEKEVIDAKARVQWCVKDDKHELSTLGCYIVQVDIADRECLTDLISRQNFESITATPTSYS